ncbi:exonuclease RecJ [Marinilabilia salmonicolor]|jgi:single-stranded-DNA-specific exonuclease|uniref:single-stranded-DNA-specific exonuclease RecJ n=1 Tax=Marinilabilia salmonicolor TaxID=989 RepID=UPI000D074244|nr:single-stranded-DNA-specific exonuclease RecJ [Marinilabilia salmonicolor]PRZ02016.1 exonuclease RecJ [Marinilabilia salmonicolor]
MEKRWSIKENPESEIEAELSAFEDIGPALGRLLALRGVRNSEEARTFFNPSLSDLHDPFLMKDMQEAVDRIQKAISAKEKILVYGDYDVDGTTSVALVYSFLRQFVPEISYYIPDRYEEGYGISYKAIDMAVEENTGLIIALDCGIKAVEKIEYACGKGVDFIICDHHTPGDVLPKAAACLDPKRPDCSYPEKNLSGCGVGFKMLQALCQQQDIDNESLFQYLDLVVVSIASDVVPIIGENRILADMGLMKLNRNPGVGLKSIIRVSGMAGRELTISDIIFKIGPRINAAGRIESGKDAVALLVSEDENKAYGMSCTINECNETRKDLDRNITREALALLEDNVAQREKKTTVLFHPEWHKGVIGIVASRLTENYYRPTVVLTESKGMITGSARSVDGYDLYHAIEACQDLLENFGGHTYAAGLTLRPENINAFIEKFEKIVSETIRPEQLVPQIEVDAEIGLGDITVEFFQNLKRFRPYGPGNLKPVFVTRNVYDFGTSKVVGKEKEHLKLEMIESTSPKIIKGIAFGKGHLLEKIKQSQPFNICYTIEESLYDNHQPFQLMVKDINFREE